MGSSSTDAGAVRAGLTRNRRRRARAEERLEEIKQEQDALVDEALDAGLDVADIARRLGVSRFTIYHRRKNR